MPPPGSNPSLVLVGALLILGGCTPAAKSTSVQSAIPTPTEEYVTIFHGVPFPESFTALPLA